ncbi:flagellar motor switch protein FliM [Tenuibacillus multivorans]|uniref:Flagellar motor switch protein FliM n=1 Tax=Tenuibacillus multivorans TaxID=237069 RepID=A0A1G9XY59_9BACI|nr:flagellar motor switch protein FliM [Tenuibacillus multivorans]GEL75869.1 flagellar motor switch protein FliM [Tenuibacillus multivorans]SDN01762.1 flagellar motor switch protein FliM [Tenuibacillus multivorans]
MSEDVLSQGEIDALLSAISSGEMDADELKQEETEQKVKVYDFKRALRFSKDQIRGLTRIHENFARLMTSALSAQLRTFVNISLVSVEQIPYEEFIRSVPKRTILNIFSVSPLEGRLLFEVNPNIGYSILDRTLGGKGNGMNKIENLTEIESRIMSRTFESLMQSLEEAWESMVEIDTALEDLEVNPQFVQLVSPNETVVVITMNTTVGESTGMINICIPHIVLEPIISKLSMHYWMQNQIKEIKPEHYDRLSKNIKHVELDAKVLLGQSTISIEEFLNLAHNDVIALNQKIDDPLLLMANEEPKFYVQPGKRKQSLAVQIIDEFRGEDDEQ